MTRPPFAVIPAAPCPPIILGELAEDIARDLAALDLAGQLGVALKLVLIVARRLPADLQAETAGEIIVALARDLPRGHS